jgi:hypothetical protein
VFYLGGREMEGKLVSEGMEEKKREIIVFPPDLSPFGGITSSK